MSENLSILDGELRRQFAPVDRLSMDNQGGGESRWVVADFLDISTLDASENGLYLAAEDDCDCYEEVEVEVSAELEEDDYRKITGIDPVDGNPYEVGVDAEGNLTKEMLPSSIHIVVPPWKREYENGEEINFYGMHVYLLDKDGHPFKTEKYPTGEIPFEELLLPITTADGSGHESGTWSDGQINALRVTYAPYEEYDYSEPPKKTGSLIWHSNEQVGTRYGFPMFVGGGQGEAELFLTLYNDGGVVRLYAIRISGENANLDLYRLDAYGAPRLTGSMGAITNAVFRITWNQGKTENAPIFSLPESTINPSGKNADDLKPVGIEIPVQWMRSDGEMLEDNFTISISEENNTGTWGESVDPINNNESGHTSGGF